MTSESGVRATIPPEQLVVYISAIVFGLWGLSASLPENNRILLWNISIPLTQWSGILSYIYLYLSLCISPLYIAFPDIPLRAQIKKSRKALGLSAFVFAVVHTITGYKSFDGLRGLHFFGPEYIVSVIVATVSMIFLTVLAITSYDALHARMRRFWKKIHRTVYLAGIAILIHIFTITTHLGQREFKLIITQFFLASLLGILEVNRLSIYLHGKYNLKYMYIIKTIGFVAVIIVLYWMSFILYHPH